MKKYRFYVSTNKIGSEMSDILIFGDEVTEDEIKECYEEWMLEKINTGWEAKETEGGLRDEKTNNR